jgi:hypothetical protein
VHVVVDQDAAQFLEDEDQSIGHQHLLQMVALVQVRHEQPLEQIAEYHRQHQSRHERRDEIAAEDRCERIREVGTDHVEAAVRQVDHAHDAEDQRQTAGDQEQQQSVLQRVQALDEEGGQIHAGSAIVAHRARGRTGSYPHSADCDGPAPGFRPSIRGRRRPSAPVATGRHWFGGVPGWRECWLKNQ